MKNKKTYISPKIESFELDREISLVMASVPGDAGPPGGDFGAAPSSTPDYPSTLNSDSPFGSTTPDYDNL